MTPGPPRRTSPSPDRPGSPAASGALRSQAPCPAKPPPTGTDRPTGAVGHKLYFGRDRRPAEITGVISNGKMTDLTQEADCRRIVRAADERFGRIDGLVNSAGDSTRGTLESTSIELWDRLFAINVRAQACVSR